MKWVVFLTVNHRGPLPLMELHSTDETIVWRDPGGSEPVYNLFTITSDFSLPQAVCDTDMQSLCGASHMEQFVFPTMDQRGEGGVGVPIYFSNFQWLSHKHMAYKSIK